MGCSTVLRSALLLCNITEDCSTTSIYFACSAISQKAALLHQSALPTLPYHREVFCSACSATSQKDALLCLLYNITEGCSALLAVQHHRGLLCYINLFCMLCNITEGCSVISICSACFTTSQRAALLYQSVLPALQHHRGLLCSATSQRAALLCLLCHIIETTLLFRIGAY